MLISDFAYKAKPNLHADLHCDDIYFCCCKLSGQTEQDGSREEACPQHRPFHYSPRSGTAKSSPLKGKQIATKVRKINQYRLLPPRHTEDPVTVYNKYGVLDQEGGDFEAT